MGVSVLNNVAQICLILDENVTVLIGNHRPEILWEIIGNVCLAFAEDCCQGNGWREQEANSNYFMYFKIIFIYPLSFLW